MKIKLLLILSILLGFYGLTKINSTYSSGKSMYFDKEKNTFIYYNTKKEDLFNSFKNLIPGDKKEEDLTIVGNNSDIYMKIDAPENEQINEKFTVKFYKNDLELLPTNGLYKVCSKDEKSVVIKMYVEIPTSIGNEISSFNNYYDITFYNDSYEEITTVPKTGEENIIIYVIAFIISLLCLIISIILIVKDKNKKAIN